MDGKRHYGDPLHTTTCPENIIRRDTSRVCSSNDDADFPYERGIAVPLLPFLFAIPADAVHAVSPAWRP